MLYGWVRCQLHTVFWLRNLKVRDYLEELVMDKKYYTDVRNLGEWCVLDACGLG